MPIEIKNLFDEPKESEIVVNQGGGGGDFGSEPPEQRVKEAKDERDLPFVIFREEEDEYVKFLINKLKCVEVTDGNAWLSGRGFRKSSFYSKEK